VLFATLSGDTLNARSFENQRVVMLLWAADCSGRARLEAAADSLVDDAALYGAHVLVVSLDSLDQVRSAGLPSRVAKAQIAVALTPKATFVNASEMAQYEPGTPAAILVPSIVLLDVDGRVRHSSWFTDRESTVNWLSAYWGR
jgi:hypothetical protein